MFKNMVYFQQLDNFLLGELQSILIKIESMNLF